MIMKRARKFLVKICVVVIVMFAFNVLGYPFWDTLKSYGVMYIYDKYVYQNSYLNKAHINFSIPAGLSTKDKDWYPIMLHHDASRTFAKYTDRNLSCMILYSFGAFDFMKGSSSFYDTNSPFQGAFYGGYVILDHSPASAPYGFHPNGELNVEEIETIPYIDQTKLVLPSVGCPSEIITFEPLDMNILKNQSYLGLDNWTRIDSLIKTNTPSHGYKGKAEYGYLQYGKPHKSYHIDEDYPIQLLKGRMYIKYIPEFKATFILYVMAKDEEIINSCDQNLLSKAVISLK